MRTLLKNAPNQISCMVKYDNVYHDLNKIHHI